MSWLANELIKRFGTVQCRTANSEYAMAVNDKKTERAARQRSLKRGRFSLKSVSCELSLGKFLSQIRMAFNLAVQIRDKSGNV